MEKISVPAPLLGAGEYSQTPGGHGIRYICGYYIRRYTDCPVCHADFTPEDLDDTCEHFFVADFGHGWEFSAISQSLHEKASRKSPGLFRELLYLDPECKSNLLQHTQKLDGSSVTFVWSEDPEQTLSAFEDAIDRYGPADDSPERIGDVR